KRLKKELGQGDHHKLDEYFESVREIERRLQHVGSPEVEGATRPKRIPDSFQDHVRLMFDMLVLAFQTDSTRIASFMLGRAGSNRSYPEIDVRNGHHEITHHRNEKKLIEKVQKID